MSVSSALSESSLGREAAMVGDAVTDRAGGMGCSEVGGDPGFESDKAIDLPFCGVE